ncbi:hypothetical protein Anas_01315 [Armadillidium nasatum]|uniref:Uncharacterized protein n=1 Tax=Armadillidium nasatum TaxID=96803 RepID=A0A5N5TH54_9CRUS|nr:hypothetical protein Anas_01315 [Armadillidium nasatum]
MRRAVLVFNTFIFNNISENAFYSYSITLEFREALITCIFYTFHLEIFNPNWNKSLKIFEEMGLKFFTPLDIYETLNDIIYERYKDTLYISETPSKSSRRISLFQSLPETRTCSDVGMPLKYCACQIQVPMEDRDGIYQKIALYLKSYMNKQLDKFKKCAKVTTLEVRKVQKVYGENIGHIMSVQAYYDPGGAIIEVTIIWDKSEEINPFRVSGDISRINKYGNQSHCIDDILLMKICVCNDML